MTVDKWSEWRSWRNIAAPAAITSVARFSMSLTDLAFLGHLGTDYLGAASLSTVWMTATGNFLQDAACIAVSTLCSQAFGAKNYPLVGIWVQIGILVGSMVALPVAVTWIFMENVAKLAGFTANAHLAGVYAQYSIIGLWPNTMYAVLNIYYQSQGIVKPGVVIGIFAALLNIVLNMLFIHGTAPFGGDWHGMKFIGSPIATSVSNWVLFLGLVLWTMPFQGLHKKTWTSTSLSNFTGKRLYEFVVKLMLPMSVGRILEDWQVEAVSLFAAHFGTADLATHNSVTMVFFVLTSTMYGMERASSVRVGHHLGNNDVPSAKFILKLTFGVASAISITIAILLASLHSELGRIFSSDPVVLSLSSKLYIMLAGGYILTSVFFSATAILNGQSRPNAVAAAFVVGAWIVCVPLAYPLSHAIHPKLVGLWSALLIGYTVTTAMAITAVLRSDWQKLAVEAQNRSEVADDANADMKPLLSAMEDGMGGTPNVSSPTTTDDGNDMIVR